MVRRVYGVCEEPWHYRIIRSFDITPRPRSGRTPSPVPSPGAGTPWSWEVIPRISHDKKDDPQLPGGSSFFVPSLSAAFVCFFLHFPVRIQKTFPVDFLSLRDDHKRSGIDIIDDLLRLVELLSVQNTDHGLSIFFPISSFAL